jgi:hypothetical protein
MTARCSSNGTVSNQYERGNQEQAITFISRTNKIRMSQHNDEHVTLNSTVLQFCLHDQ